MTETIAAKIADGEDLLRPSSWRGHDLAPYIAAGVLCVKCYDPGEFTCDDCDWCLDNPPKVVAMNGRYVARCTPGKVRQVDASEIAVYEIDVGAVVGLVAKALGCGNSSQAAGMAGVWRLGLSGVTFAKHKRQVWFFRKFDEESAQRLSSIPDSGDGAIVIAAELDMGLGAEAAKHAFGLADLMRIDGDGVAGIDLDPIRLRFEAIAAHWRLERQAAQQPSKSMVESLATLADHLKAKAIGFIVSRKKGTRTYEDVLNEMKKLTQKSIAKQTGIEPNTLNRYLKTAFHPELAEAQAVRLWYAACTVMDFQQTVAETIHEHWPRQTDKAYKLSGVELYSNIYKFIDAKRRRIL